MAVTKRRRVPEVIDMNDLQLLAHLLTMAGTDVTRARELSHSLLDAHQSLAQVLALPSKTLLHFPTLGEPAAVFLLLLPALMERYTVKKSSNPSPANFWGPAEIETCLLPHFQDQRNERVCLFCLGEHFELLTATLLTQGGTAAVSCSVSRVMKLALTHRSHSVFLAHNHPDGVKAFSKSDLLATSIVAHALTTVDVTLADHLLLAGDEIISLRGLSSANQLDHTLFVPPPAWKNLPWPLTSFRIKHRLLLRKFASPDDQDLDD